ncbi:hypothetical protein VQ381_004657 [Salmonella enterica]|nr:hypothetical protein [Salmonella enterica]ECC1244004.1 hypothetical protein [Salmonella enterica subsp. enterica serovar Poona]MLT78229.1 hypothetical protein [Salmonella enterica subsp. enterica serovar Sandiego]EAV0793159.1 hypothetical protein [Salmonella enterica]EBA1299005.1 hypothetical protein [Salmonella enterica]
MTLKFRITKEEFDALTEEQQALYGESGEGYQIAIEGLPDTSALDGLKLKVEELLSEKKAEQKKREEAEAEAEKERLEKLKKSGDIESLEKSWQEKLEKAEQDSRAKIDALNASIHKMLVDNVALDLATSLCGEAAPVILPHLKTRLTVETDSDGNPVTRVVDSAGKLSAASLDDLKKEFTGNKLFSALIIDSRASGTGGEGGEKKPDAGGERQKKKNVTGDPMVDAAREIISNMKKD